MATINVNVRAKGVSAVENPQSAQQTETVTWVFTFIGTDSDNLRQVLKKVEPPKNSCCTVYQRARPLLRTVSMIEGQIQGHHC